MIIRKADECPRPVCVVDLPPEVLNGFLVSLSTESKLSFVSCCRALRRLAPRLQSLWDNLCVKIRGVQHLQQFAEFLAAHRRHVRGLTITVEDAGGDGGSQLLAFLLGALTGSSLTVLRWDCGSPVRLGDWVALPPALRQLEVGAPQVEVLPQFSSVTALTSLSLGLGSCLDGDVELLLHPGCLPPGLRELSLWRTPPDIFSRLAPQSPHLLALDCSWPGGGLDFCHLPSFTALTSLSLASQGLRRVPPEVAALTQLRTLALTCCPLSEGDGGVAHLLPLARLTELSITVSSLAEELPAPLLCLPQLEHLWLLGVDKMPPLRPPPSPSPLKELGLDCRMAVRSTACLTRLASLEQLCLSGDWEGRGMEQKEVEAFLRALSTLPQLERSSSITGRVAKAIAAAFPGLARRLPLPPPLEPALA